jgi:hypothetical protein
VAIGNGFLSCFGILLPTNLYRSERSRGVLMKRLIATTVIIALVLSGALPAFAQGGDVPRPFRSSGGSWGYVNAQHCWVVSPQFTRAEAFQDGMARVGCGTKWGVFESYGFIDPAGRIRTACTFEPTTSNFSEGLASFQVDWRSKFGFMDRTGSTVIAAQFDSTLGFSHELAAVKIGERWGYIDHTGRMLISPQFDDAKSFSSEGIASVRIGARWGLISRSGEVIFNPRSEYPIEFQQQRAAVKVRDRWGFIDINGRIVIDPSFESTRGFQEGLAAVSIGGKWGFIDFSGKVIIPSQFEHASSFAEGVAVVKNSHGRRYFIDTRGQEILRIRAETGSTLEFEEIWGFSEGLSGFKVGGLWGFLDKSGLIVIPPQFDGIFPFRGGRAGVLIGERYLQIDRTGRVLLDPTCSAPR